MVRRVLSALVPGLLLFVPLFLGAGHVGWPLAWAFVGLFVAGSLATGLWLRRADPALLAERTKSPFRSGQRPRDRAIMAVLFAGFPVWLACLGLDARFGWSHVPRWVPALGAALIAASFIGWVFVLRANSFASNAILIQAERGHTVISTGPYAVVRHPMYSVALGFLAGVPLMLGSSWGLLALAVFVPLLAARTLGEERVLLEGLPGYRAYSAKVRYRLLPGVW